MQKFKLSSKLYVISCEGHDPELLLVQNSQSRIVFVLEGNGVVSVGDHRFLYAGNSIFLVGPGQRFSLESADKTRLFIVVAGQFRPRSFRAVRPVNGLGDLLKRIQFIFKNLSSDVGMVLKSHGDQSLINTLIQLMNVEMRSSAKTSEGIVKSSVVLLMDILLKNIGDSRKIRHEVLYHDEIDNILDYIANQIRLDQKVDIKEIGSQFNVNQGQIESSIIARTGISFKKYIVKSKMEVFQSRLLRPRV